MKAPDAKWDWTPPSLWFGRPQVYIAMGVLTAIAAFIALKGESTLESEFDMPYEEAAVAPEAAMPAPEPEPQAAQEEFSSAAAEVQVVAAGYQVAQAWTPLQVAAGDQVAITLSLEEGTSYVMLAKGTIGCDTNLIMSDSIKDVGPGTDAHLIFDVSTAGEAVVTIPAASSDLTVCDVSYAVFRR